MSKSEAPYSFAAVLRMKSAMGSFSGGSRKIALSAADRFFASSRATVTGYVPAANPYPGLGAISLT